MRDVRDLCAERVVLRSAKRKIGPPCAAHVLRAYCVARRWGVSRQRVHQVKREPEFPGPCRTFGADRTRPYPGASGAAGGVDARRWRILSSNPA